MPDLTDANALLAQLEAERAELDVTINHLRRLLGMGPASGETTTGAIPMMIARGEGIVTGRVRPDEFFRLSMSEAIAKYLNIMKQPQNPAAIVAGLRSGGILSNAKNFAANVNTELKRMRQRGITVNTGSGWALAEWYPQKPKANETTKPRKKTRQRTGKAKKATTTTATKTTKTTKTASNGAGDHADGKPKRTGPWHAFAAEKIHAGMSMAEAGAAWRKMKAGG